MNRPATLDSPWSSFLCERWGRVALAGWALLALGSAIRAVLVPHRQHFDTTYRPAALHWLDGASLYGDWIPPYRSSPTFAVLMEPLAILPTPLGNVLWGLVSLVLLLFAVRALSMWVFPWAASSRHFALLLLLTLPGAGRGLWSSQAHAITAACLFFAVAAISRDRWWTAGLLLALAFYVKLAPVTFGATFVLLWPRKLGPRWLVWMAGLALVPFLTTDATYVLEQYASWWQHLQGSAATRWEAFRDLQHVWELSGLPFNLAVYRALQVVAGLGTAAACWFWARVTDDRRQVLTTSFALVGCYNLLLGPAVEFNQYILIAPFLVWALIGAARGSREKGLLTASYVLCFVFGAGTIERRMEAISGSQAVTALLVIGLLVFLAWLIWSLRAPASRSGEEASMES